ncbi:hypothetical protein CTEN210_03437 [Chaetoceros tenuissimus]|uniref:Uncharacterized protein n=1 Tax=Chaetoceros tenuissimus TaxID=426638 RepID=A0AAD3CIY9_9STRA|nr:hypothetical protein CTEN210_03437 [Chaetoceros tenuissimus]
MKVLLLLAYPIFLIQTILSKTIVITTILSLIYIFLNQFGIIHRLLQIWIEYQVPIAVTNGSPVTFSSLDFELFNFTSLRTTLILHDGIVHTKDQQEWRWESPLIARVGYTKVTFNLWSLLDLPPHWKELLGIEMTSIKDLYTVELKDVQIFIEKKRNVFNFHLLDERLDIPDSQSVLKSIYGSNLKISKGNVSFVENETLTKDQVDNNVKEENSDEIKKADEFVTSIVQAVSTLGRAANEGGTRGLSNALKNQKDGFVSQLKKVQDMVGLNHDDDDQTPSSNPNAIVKEKKQNKSIGIAKEGIEVMKQVGKVVEKNVLNMKEQVDILSKPPPIRQDFVAPKHPDLFRFGYIEIRDARIFTKEIIVVPNADQEKKSLLASSKVSSDNLVNLDSASYSTSALGWSKPIFLKEIKVYPSEFCAPKDVIDPFKIGQPIEVCMNIILEKIFTEMATSSISGKLLNNAFSDVFSLFDSGLGQLSKTNSSKST